MWLVVRLYQNSFMANDIEYGRMVGWKCSSSNSISRSNVTCPWKVKHFGVYIPTIDCKAIIGGREYTWKSTNLWQDVLCDKVQVFFMPFLYNSIFLFHGLKLLTKFGLCKPIAINYATQLVCVGDGGTIIQIDQANAIIGQV